ncbi:hypothetical protein E4U41_002529, partial [Claviceps citrina]
AYFLGLADRLVEVVAAAPEASQQDREGRGRGRGQGQGQGQGQGSGHDGDGPAVLGKARRMALAEAVRLAREICEGGPVAIRAGLQAVASGMHAMEREMYERVVATEDRDEALRAFGEKRKPVFRGR